MSLYKIIETLLIGPLKLLFEIIFEISGRFISHPGLCIVFLSLAMNILVLPLYRRADAMQEMSRDTEAKLHRGVSHIKKAFSGDERMMILQTYYRQNNYKPTDALHGSVSLLLEIPFFMAAYQFLSGLEILKGVSFGPIADLGAPDRLLVIGGIAVNLLPVLMTLVNVVSSALYLRGFPLKTKIQLYGMALFFLVFLYRSPSGLVFYWTLNNVFSLVKTIFYKIKNPKKVLRILTTALGLVFIGYSLFFFECPSLKKKLFLILIGVALLLPLIIHVRTLILPKRADRSAAKPNRKVFLLGALFATLFIGVLIPSTFIAASPQEYVDVSYFHNPLRYVVGSAAMAAGTFFVWMRVFYWLASDKGKVMFDRIIWIFCGIICIDYMFFGTKLGIISEALQYENGMSFTVPEQLINIGILVLAAAILFVLIYKWSRVTVPVLLTAAISIGAMSTVNIVRIKTSIDSIAVSGKNESANFNLSRNGKNVVVIMLDRAMGMYVPYILNEKPELKDAFSGFTYYSNTISFGGWTNFGAPALYGGYEYTPVEMNKRDGELLVDKHNEALRLMPSIFSGEGYEVTTCDPVYANYEWIPNISIFDDMPNVNAFITKGNFSDPAQKQYLIDSNYRNFFCFSVMKSLPLALQPSIYAGGTYNKVDNFTDISYSTQTVESTHVAEGLSKTFMDGYNVLLNMANMTSITDEGKNTFLMLSSDVTHEPMLLSEPDYVPAEHVDNTEFDAANEDRFIVDGKRLLMDTNLQMMHYHANMSALLRLGEWFDYLRDEGVYDNTRIIIVSDHGRHLWQREDLVMGEWGDAAMDAELFYPLLLVKDFNSEEFNISDEFMTNADVPTMAMSGLVEDPTNPFTGKTITNSEKTAHDQFVILSYDWSTAENNGNTYFPSRWAKVKDDLRVRDNWAYYQGEVVLKDYAFPEGD